MSFTGKTALITGACGGLGKAIAEAFLSEGAQIVVCDINKDLIADFNQTVASAHADRTLVLETNITDDSALDDLFAQALSKFGHLDCVINSAGVMDDFSPAGDMSRATWEKVIGVNLTAPTMITQRAVNHMRETGIKGAIVNIASIAAVRGYTAGCAYTVSKHGVVGLTRNTAAFYGPSSGIRCNAILAGGMDTNIADDYVKGRVQWNMEGMGVMTKSCRSIPVAVDSCCCTDRMCSPS